MSNIKNQGVDMNKKTLAELSFSAVKELSDEVAATSSGGVATIYRDINFQGGGIAYSFSDPNLVDNNFNDTTSSIIISPGETWRFYRDVEFRGPFVTLGEGSYSFVPNVGIPNDSISSLVRIG
ncbi:beta/gamma crystallin-related protein [Nostoc flagelliforme]|uniref:beta/gamma crystallin-related protein n=1 Tax=Nostoc flagelliforme TaxID=1306274 RepID=UPI000C2D2ECA|nr:beta/gamma crystallin-related protein [Nostoc flagelliforme]